MNSVFKYLFLLLGVSCSTALIIPEELPSILSLVYSNIPPIKKGTDSRLGLGFRLGEHADFQVVLEIGPQSNTQPLGGSSTSNKRHVAPPPLIYSLKQRYRPEKDIISNTDGGKWLSSWREQISGSQNQGKSNGLLPNIADTETVVGIGEIKASDVIPDDMYEVKTENEVPKVSSVINKATENVSDLSDVSLDN